MEYNLTSEEYYLKQNTTFFLHDQTFIFEKERKSASGDT